MSTIGASPLTVTAADVASCSCRLTLTVASSVTVAFFCEAPKPSRLALTLYGPGGRLGNRNRPSAPVVAVRPP